MPLSHASSAASRPPSQGWGPGWLATPSLYDSFIRDSMPVYPGAIQSCARSAPARPRWPPGHLARFALHRRGADTEFPVAGGGAPCGCPDGGQAQGLPHRARAGFGRYSRINSTRQLRARPAIVSLDSLGWLAPNPCGSRRAGSIRYWVTKACLTAAARRFERSRL